MKHSATHSKVTFNFPDFVSISKWIEWQTIEWKNDLYSKILSISIVSGKDISEIRTLPVGFLAQLYEESINMMRETHRPVFAIKYKGEELYFGAPHLATIGEVADIEFMMASDKPYEVLKVLFREVDYDNTGIEWEKISDDISVKYITNFEENYSKYSVKKYDVEEIKKTKLGDVDFWSDFPAPIYQSCLGFIAGIGISSLINFNHYSKELNQDEMKSLMATLDQVGDGFLSLSVLQKVTFSQSQETNQSQT